MIRFRSEFLSRFPPKQRSELNQFTSFVSGVEEALRKSPELHWRAPSDPRAMFDYYVELIWQANGVRCASLCCGIVQNLNELNFLSFAVLLRALFENVLLARQYFHSRLLPIVDACAKQGRVPKPRSRHDGVSENPIGTTVVEIRSRIEQRTELISQLGCCWSPMVWFLNHGFSSI
jgi:hypothetical protein